LYSITRREKTKIFREWHSEVFFCISIRPRNPDKKMNIQRNGVRIKLPDFLIVGAARSGTTTLFSLLDRHPRIFMPREKEPMFFSVYDESWIPIDIRTGKPAAHVIGDLNGYLGLFRSARDGRLIGEASTWYLYRHQTTIRNIRAVYGENARDVRIIILLRNPAERAWSHYQLKKRSGEEELPFDRAIDPDVIRGRLEKRLTPGFDYIGFGRYFQQVKAYLENFPQARVLLFEDMMKDTGRAEQEACELLGIEPGPAQEQTRKLNVSGAPKNRLLGMLGDFLYQPAALKSLFKPWVPYKLRADLKHRLSARIFRPERLDAGLKDRLTDIFRDDIQALAGLTGKDLTGWLQASPGPGK